MARPWCSASRHLRLQSLHSRKHDHEVQLYAFDCLALGGDDLCRLPLHLRKTNLAQPLRGRAEGIFVAPFAQGEIGPELFEAACRMGLEGLVSKHRERVYRGGRCDHWIKVKNRKRRRQHLRKKERDLQSTCMLVSETSLFTRLGPLSCQVQKNAPMAATS